ncbi:MAG: hypothetical protein HN380_08190, partial [Victivallales bacterium]|nr:hypothetical protein [Victivallales bacterium]
FLKGQVLLLDDHRVALLAFTKGLRTQTGGSAKAYYLEGLAHLKDNQPLHALQSFRDARGWGLTRESGPAATGSKVFNSVMSGEMVEVFERELELQFLEGLQDKATNQAKAFQSMFSQETAERAEMDKERGPIGTWFRRLFKAGLYDTVETGVDLYRGGDSVAEARADEVGTVGDEMAKTHIAIGVVKGLRKAGFRLDAIHKMTREQFHAAAEKAWERKMSPEKIDKLRIVMMSHGFSNPDMQDLLSGRDLTEKGVLSGTMVQKMEDTSGWATARYVGKTAGNAVNGWVLATSFAPSAQLGILAGSSRSVSATTTLGEFFAGCNATQHALTRMSESAMGRKALEHVDDFLAIGRSGKGGAARMLALEAGGSMAVSYLAKEIGGEPAAMAADIFMMAGGSSQFWGEAMGKAGLTKDQVQRAALALSRRVQVTGSKLDDVSALALRTRKAIEEAGQGGVDKALLAKIQAELGDLGEHLPGPVQRLRGALGDATAGRNASALEHLKSTGRQVKNKRARLQATQQNAKTMGQAAEEIPRRDLAMPGTRRQAGDLGPDGATVSVDAGGGTRVPQDLAVGGGPRQGGDPLTRSQPGGAATSVNAGGGTRAQRDLGTPGTRRRGGGPATRQQPGGAATSVDAGGGTRAQRDLGEPGTRIGEGNPGTRQQAGGAAATGGGRTGDPSTGSPGTQPAPKIAPEKLRLHTDNPLARTHKADKLMAANRFAEAHDELATLRKGLEQAITENPALRRELEEACLEVVTKQRWAKEAAETFAGCKPLPANTITRRLGEEDDLLVRMAILNSKNPQRAAEFAGTQRMPHLEAMPNPYLKDIGKGVSGKQWVISYVQDAEGAAGEVMRSQSGKAYARAVAVVREVTDDDVAGMAEEIASRVFAAAGRPGPHSRVIQIPAGGRLRDYLVTKVLDSGIDLEDLSPGIPQMMARKKDLAQDLAYRLLFGDPDCHFGNIRISDAGYAQGIDYGGGDFLRSHPDFRDVEAMEGAVTQINRFRSRLKEMVANPGKHGVSEEAARQASEALESAAKRLNVDPSGVPDIPGLGSEDTRQAVLDAVDAIRELKHADLPVESAGSYLNTLSQSSLYQHPIFRTNPAALSDADFSRFVESSMGVHFDFAVKQWGDPNGIVRSAISLEDCAGALREIQENVRPQISDIIEKAMKRVPAAERAYTEKLLLKRIDMLESFLKGKFPPLQ